MKPQLKRRFIILLMSLLLVTGISTLLNRASFDPNFSVIDALSSATKRTRKTTSTADSAAAWSYSADDLVLSDKAAYIEETVTVGNHRYILLRKADLPNGTLLLLSDKNNSDYAKAVQQAAEYYGNLGYTVEIREYSETMMLSLAHAEHFDLFLLREEAAA